MLDGCMVNMVASALMNGVCCIHSMHEEEENRRKNNEMIRKAIMVEWEKQRLLDQERREKQLRDQGLDDMAIVAEHRRRVLMAAKIDAATYRPALAGGSLVGRKNPTYHDEDLFYDVDTTMPIQFRQRTSETVGRIVSPSSLSHRVRTAPVWQGERFRRSSTTMSVALSLLDGNDDDEEEEMEEVSVS